MLKENEIKVGDTHSAVLVDDLKRTQIVQYAGASGDYNPLHTDEIFTTQVAGYPSVFAHGMLSCLLYTSPSPRDIPLSRMPSSA